jgi:DNA-directed RNA polymerase specialized sigma24 family protein
MCFYAERKMLKALEKMARAAADPKLRDAFANPSPGLLVKQTSALRVLARTLARNDARAQGLVQETLLKAWGARARYQPDTRLRAWLGVILRNTWFSDVRKQRREVEDVDDA